MTNPHDAFSGVDNEKIVDYQAGALEQRVLHMQTSDPLRTPTYTLFPKPDYFFATTDIGTPPQHIGINPGFAYDHGYYSPNIDITWVGIAGKGAAVNGVDGPEPAQGNQPSDPESTNTVPEASTGRHVGRGDRHPADDALPRRAHRRLPVGRARDHAGPEVAVRPAQGRAGPRSGLRPAQLERGSVRDRTR